MKKLTKAQQVTFDKYKHVIDQVTELHVKQMKARINDDNFAGFLDVQSFGMAQLEAVQKTAIWTLEKDNLIDAIVEYCHQSWKRILNFKYEKEGVVNA